MADGKWCGEWWGGREGGEREREREKERERKRERKREKERGGANFIRSQKRPQRVAGGSLEKAIAATPLTGMSPLTDASSPGLYCRFLQRSIKPPFTLHPTAAFGFAWRRLQFYSTPLLNRMIIPCRFQFGLTLGVVC